MSCERYQEWIAALLAEELGEDERSELREHLSRCASCRGRLFREEPALALAYALPRGGFEDGAFVGEVLTGIHQRRAARELSRTRVGKLARLAAAVALAALLVFAASRVFGPERVATPVAQVAPSAPEPFVEVEGEGVRVYQLATEQQVQVAFVVSPSMEL
jgi:predicted anti-sigma-YlaC factor YlaD